MGGSILQVLFLACFVGVMINRAGDRAMPIKEAIEFLNRLCMDMIDVVVQFIPLLVFASMAHLMLSTGLDALLPLGKVLIGDVIGLGLVFLICAAFVAAFGGKPPIPFLKKLAGFAPVPFALNSSNACLPQTISFCAEKFGVDRKLSMFAAARGHPVQHEQHGISYRHRHGVDGSDLRHCVGRGYYALNVRRTVHRFLYVAGMSRGGTHRSFHGLRCRRRPDGSGDALSVY